MEEKSPENYILAKRNYSCNSWSSEEKKLELDLYMYYVKTNSYTIFFLKSISQKMAMKSTENWSVTDRRTDRQTNSQQTKSTPGKLGRGQKF